MELCPPDLVLFSVIYVIMYVVRWKKKYNFWLIDFFSVQ